jgi:hypothetical protein
MGGKHGQACEKTGGGLAERAEGEYIKKQPEAGFIPTSGFAVFQVLRYGRRLCRVLYFAFLG